MSVRSLFGAVVKVNDSGDLLLRSDAVYLNIVGQQDALLSPAAAEALATELQAAAAKAREAAEKAKPEHPYSLAQLATLCEVLDSVLGPTSDDQFKKGEAAGHYKAYQALKDHLKAIGERA